MKKLLLIIVVLITIMSCAEYQDSTIKDSTLDSLMNDTTYVEVDSNNVIIEKGE